MPMPTPARGWIKTMVHRRVGRSSTGESHQAPPTHVLNSIAPSDRTREGDARSSSIRCHVKLVERSQDWQTRSYGTAIALATQLRGRCYHQIPTAKRWADQLIVDTFALRRTGFYTYLGRSAELEG
jgi:hypothetical protein